jgi:hypothetical protein
MKGNILSRWLLTALVLAGTHKAYPQGLPKTQPKLITIFEEEVKVGRGPEHAKHESGFPAAYEKAKSPYYYLAMTSVTGHSEAWYISPWESHAAIGDSMKREDSDPFLSAELARLGRLDAEYINSFRIVQAAARTELSFGTFPDLSKARFFEVTTFRIRPGHEQQFEEASKAYLAAAGRSAPKASYRIYEVMAGMPSPTILIISSVEKYADFDQTFADDKAIWKGATPEEMAVLQKFASEGLVSSESNRFRVDPVQSYVSKETRAQDPEFWNPK